MLKQNRYDPHLFYLKMCLEQLNRGNHLYLGPTSFTTLLEGCPWVIHVARWMKQYELIKQIDESDFTNIGKNFLVRYQITEKGILFLKDMKNWWKSLSFTKKLAIRFYGGHFPKWIDWGVSIPLLNTRHL